MIESPITEKPAHLARNRICSVPDVFQVFKSECLARLSCSLDERLGDAVVNMKMRLQTRRDVIRNAAARWRQTYTWGGKFSGPYPWGDPKAIYDKLISLNLETCSKAELEAVYNGLALNRCDECGNDREVLVRFGPEPDYEEGPFDICPTCLKRAIALIG